MEGSYRPCLSDPVTNSKFFLKKMHLPAKSSSLIHHRDAVLLADPDSVADVAAKGVEFIDIEDAESGGCQMEVWRTHYLEGVPEEVGQRMVSIKRHSKPAARFQQLQS